MNPELIPDIVYITNLNDYCNFFSIILILFFLTCMFYFLKNK